MFDTDGQSYVSHPPNSVITVRSGQDGMFQCEGWNGGSSPTEEGWKIRITSYFREDFKNNKQVMLKSCN